MRVSRAEFLASASRLEDLPQARLPEVAFAGRSNVGKSALINALLMRRSLVRTGSSPGTTRRLNFFVVNDQIGFVDLPGYGYARVSKTERARWRPLIEGYLSRRENLRAVVLIMDIRHEPFDSDRQLLEWLEQRGIPAILVATKADKLSRSRQVEQHRKLAEALGVEPEALILFSAKTRQGRGELWQAIRKACQP
jgi:GTP-binding protein